MPQPVKRILAFGAPLPLNLGGPSIFHGTVQAWRHSFPGCAITYLQPPTTASFHIKEPQWPNVEVCEMPTVSGRQWLACLARLKLGLDLNALPDVVSDLIRRIRAADLVISVWGINYSSKLGRRNLRGLLVTDPLIRVARRLGVGTVHYTASYGPISDLPTRIAARFILGRYYDLIYCREIESERLLRKAGIKAMTVVCPDTGLLMPKGEDPEKLKSKEEAPMVGISVSHQILRHWTATEPYLDILARFCQLAVRQWRASVILFPNEINRPGERNDTTVALHIKERARLGDRLRIFPAEQFTAGEQKAAIGNCSLLVASRYHSVVAALSSGVPTVVVGWHHKYRELLEHYGQAQFCLSASDCSTERLWQLAGGCWVRRQELHDQIEKNHAAVVRRIYTGAEELRSVVPIR